MLEYMLGAPGICLLTCALGVVAVARALLRASDASAQLAKTLAKLDRDLLAARESIPEIEARVAELKSVVPGLKRKYAAIDKYVSELVKLDSAMSEDEKEEDERRKALGMHKVSRQ